MLEIRDLNVFYGEFQALSNIDLDVEALRIVSLMGANSAGKSTLLNTISGILRPGSGTITFEGKRIDGLEPHVIVDLGIALVPEGRKIFSNLTVRENLLIGSYTSRARELRGETFENILDLFPHLKERLRQKAGDLSGGEQQMLSIGRALMSKPHFIMFDEISLGLGPLVVKELYGTIEKMNHKGLTVILVEQDINQGLKVSDFACILQEGRIRLKGNPGYFTEDMVKKAYFGL